MPYSGIFMICVILYEKTYFDWNGLSLSEFSFPTKVAKLLLCGSQLSKHVAEYCTLLFKHAWVI